MKPFGDWEALYKCSLCQMSMMETAIINMGNLETMDEIFPGSL